MQHIFIVNPTSAKGKPIVVAQVIKECCDQKKLDYQIFYTTRPKEATEIAQKFSQERDHVIYSVGGDGTLFEVINGMMPENKALLSVVPAGSGNDFYRTIQDQKEPFWSVDVGQMNEYYFLNSASVGLDAEVVNNITKMKQLHIPPSMIYKASILYSYFKYQPYEITMFSKDISRTNKITIFAVCNGKYYGGGFPIAPKAKIDDGKFDIYEVDQLSKLQIPSMLSKLTKGTHESASCVHHDQKDSIVLKSNQELVCNLDGEAIRDNTFDFKMAPQKITLYEGHPAVKKLIKEQIIK